MHRFKAYLFLALFLGALFVSPPVQAQIQHCYNCEEFTTINGEPRFICAQGGLSTWDNCTILNLLFSQICYTSGNFCYLA